MEKTKSPRRDRATRRPFFFFTSKRRTAVCIILFIAAEAVKGFNAEGAHS